MTFDKVVWNALSLYILYVGTHTGPEIFIFIASASVTYTPPRQPIRERHREGKRRALHWGIKPEPPAQ